jgi:hypothetical protein
MTNSLDEDVVIHGNEPTDAPLVAGSLLKAGNVVWYCFLSFILMQILDVDVPTMQGIIYI